MNKQTRQKLVIAGGSVLLGITTLVLMALASNAPSWWLFGVLVVVYAYLEFNSVLLSERLAISPAVMALFAAAVIFGPEATFGAVAIAAAGTLSARDFTERRWFEPAANFGQLVLSAAVGVTVLGLLVPAEITIESLWLVAAASAIAALIYNLVNMTLVGFIVRVVFGNDIWAGVEMREVVVPFVAMGFLGGLLGAAYLLVGPATMPLIIIGLLVGQFALRSYGRVLGSHDSALRAFARALEAKDLYSRGRSDQVAHFADLACDALGIGDQRRERMRTAALLREVTKLAVPHEIYRKPGPLHPDELHHLRIQMCRVSDLLADVEFLRPSLEIGNAGMADRPPDCTPAERPAPSGLRLDAAILAVAVAFEAMTSARSYRAAKTQPEAIAELRANQGTQFDPEAVDAFLQGLNASGEVHGAPPTEAPFEGALHG